SSRWVVVVSPVSGLVSSVVVVFDVFVTLPFTTWESPLFPTTPSRTPAASIRLRCPAWRGKGGRRRRSVPFVQPRAFSKKVFQQGEWGTNRWISSRETLVV